MGSSSGRRRLEERVVRAAEQALADKHYITPIDVLVGLGWLAPSHLDRWRQGRVEHLEGVTNAGLGKISTAMEVFRGWARDRGLTPSEVDSSGRASHPTSWSSLRSTSGPAPDAKAPVGC